MADEPTLKELAIQYATLAKQDYESGQLGGDAIEAEMQQRKLEMAVKFGDFRTQEAIKEAYAILGLFDYHG